MENPRLTPIKAGWAARGNGWAVHGKTREEALRLFQEAENHHQIIMSRPDNERDEEEL